MLTASTTEDTIGTCDSTTSTCQTMKAIVCTGYGSPDVLMLEDVKKPTPAAGEVLVKVYAASVNAGDWHLMRADPCLVRLFFGLLKPKHRILGADIAGRVEAVGKNVTQFKAGDEVFGDVSESGFGAFAEFACVSENTLTFKPDNMKFEEAAAVPSAAVTALQGLRDQGAIQAGSKVLINGASGGVGTFAVQIAKSFGAQVTAVCSTEKMKMMRVLGADHVIDYTQEDFTENGQYYDLILAANGYHPISDYKRALAPEGVYVMSGGSMAQLFQAMFLGIWMSDKDGRVLGNFLVKPNQQDLKFMKFLIETREVIPVIDRRYPLHEVADAIRYLEEGHARGKVVITMEHGEST